MVQENQGDNKYKETYSRDEVRTVLKWVRRKCKEKQIQRDTTDNIWGEYHEHDKELKAMLEIKVGLEKYFKKLRWEEKGLSEGEEENE